MFQIGVFAKYWEPGKVKTRLAESLGDVEAANLYRQFVEVLLERFGHVANRRVLAYWPAERLEQFAALTRKHWQLEQQTPGNLGCRMTNYFRKTFSSGASAAALIGSDSPTLPADTFERTQRGLKSADVVLGPTEDGGYYLVGLTRWIPEIFQDILWSSDRVFEQTVEKLSRLGLNYATLPTWYDIDDWHDLLRMQSELSEYRGNEGALLRLGRSVELAVRGVDRNE